MKQENLIQLAKEMLELHNSNKIDLYTWANARELVEWFLVIKLPEQTQDTNTNPLEHLFGDVLGDLDNIKL